eukprot:12894259-Prorocentrum_lima.AAC.1
MTHFAALFACAEPFIPNPASLLGTDWGAMQAPVIPSLELQELLFDIKSTAPGLDGVPYDQLKAFTPC